MQVNGLTPKLCRVTLFAKVSVNLLMHSNCSLDKSRSWLNFVSRVATLKREAKIV